VQVQSLKKKDLKDHFLKNFPDGEDFRKAFGKHLSKPAFDIPIKYFIYNKKNGETTINKLLKDLKCALIVNVASKCGHTAKHY